MHCLCKLLAAALTTPSLLIAQTAPAAAPAHEVSLLAALRTQASIDQAAKELVAQAQKSLPGAATSESERFPGYTTMLTARVRDSGAEMHKAAGEVWVVEQGEAIVVTGGTLPNPKEISPGEQRGVRLTGGTRHSLHKGDILQIPPGTTHQVLIAGGKTFVCYVVRVDAPASATH